MIYYNIVLYVLILPASPSDPTMQENYSEWRMGFKSRQFGYNNIWLSIEDFWILFK